MAPEIPEVRGKVEGSHVSLALGAPEVGDGGSGCVPGALLKRQNGLGSGLCFLGQGRSGCRAGCDGRGPTQAIWVGEPGPGSQQSLDVWQVP